MGTKVLAERFAFQAGRVDRSGPRPVIRDVLLCGPTSANRRRYPRAAFAGDRVLKYAGRPVFLNHGDGRGPRRYEDRIAKVINPRHRADGMPVGDLEVRPKHPFAEAFLDDAENDPTSVGMSHVARCRTAPGRDGWEEVRAVEEVESVDVVLDPATTRGLYEHTRRTAVGKISLRQFGDRFGPAWGPRRWTAFVRLCEAVGPPADAPVMDDPPPGPAGPGDLKAALTAALAPLLDDAFETGDPTRAVAALKDFIRLHARHAGGGSDTPDPMSDGDDAGDDPSAEGRRRPTVAGLVAEARAAGLADPTPADLAVLEGITTPAARRAYCERVTGRPAGADRPRSAGKRPGAGPVPGRGRDVTESVPPADGKAFARWVSE
ncbi:MAG TPA: hypothetical protein VH092_31070 [Urbifossiella sp.]|jgi:hypothetical protein|nr:hypothetical protein [Urbifossiella sp.]